MDFICASYPTTPSFIPAVESQASQCTSSAGRGVIRLTPCSSFLQGFADSGRVKAEESQQRFNLIVNSLGRSVGKLAITIDDFGAQAGESPKGAPQPQGNIILLSRYLARGPVVSALTVDQPEISYSL